MPISPEHLVDRAEIHDLLVRLAIAQDDNDWDALADCYEPDATYHHPDGEQEGVEPIVDRARRGLTPLDSSQHLIGTILVTVDADGDSASSSTYFQAQHVRHDAPGGDRCIIAGTYRDRLVRRDGVWRIRHRTQEYSWRSGNPKVFRRDDPDAVAPSKG